MIEKELVTTDAMLNFVEELKNKVYNWTNPDGTGFENWKEIAQLISGKYKLVPTSNEEILSILKENDLLKEEVVFANCDANKLYYSFDVANTSF